MQQAISFNLYPIILGDFNTDNSTITSSTTKFQLLNYLHGTNMYDLADYTDNLQNTWQSSRYQTKIDYIWAHDALIPHLHKFKLDNSSSSTNSNHQILTSTWVFPFATTKIRHKSKSKRRIFNYKIMSREDWNNFTDQIDSNMIQHKVPTLMNITNSLENTWHKIHTSIINAELQYISNKKYTIRNFHHTLTPKATQLHHNLKTIGHI